VEQDIAFSREFTFIEPGGRRSVLRRDLAAASAFRESFLKLSFLNFGEKLAVAARCRRFPRD
jgi:hypothetical protein